MALLHPTGPLGAADLEDTLEKNTSIQPPKMSDDDADDVADPAEDGAGLGPRRAAWLARHQAQATLLEEAVRRHDGNVSSAARELGISRQQAQRLMIAMQERRR
jgi:transcriptional regulator of acetoin/glycerol metabolism